MAVVTRDATNQIMSEALIPAGESSSDPFSEAPEQAGFERFGHDNSFRYWWAGDLAVLLGYDGVQGFRKAINAAMTVLQSLNVPIYENIVQEQRQVDGRPVDDFKLSRFACYLVAINGDVRKPEVAKAQAYFASWAEACRLSLEESGQVERVQVRADVSDREKSLAGVAKVAGVDNYAFFQNAGYRGLYNMNLRDIRRRKSVPTNRSPLDFMGKTELAANLFRTTQTEEKIRSDRIRGQRALEGTAERVGQEVRQAMYRISAKRPENLPPAEDIVDVKRRLKNTHTGMRKLDKPKPKPKKRG